jgi:type III restriction enzyme
MKIQFDPNLDFQQDSVAAISDIFKGQEICRTNFTVSPLKYDPQMPLTVMEPSPADSHLGVGNRLKLLEEELLENIRGIQLRNGLRPAEGLEGNKFKEFNDFTVEMETGTGKTYIYLRTIFEMNRLYGFSKFIIVVPSVAIKEGVFKSLQMTEEHFRGIYDNIQYDYFVYDSQKLGQVRGFATNDYLQIMVINIDAFRKSFTDPKKENKANIIHRPHDRMTGSRPIEFIQATNPIVIIDEPQSVATTPKSREAIRSLNPLCTFRYSATHIEKHQMMYKLDAVDAYQKKLVKQIEVTSTQVEDSYNKAFIKLLKVDHKKSPITAQIEMDIHQKNGRVKRMRKTVRTGDDLLDISGGRDVYDGYIIEEIYCEPGKEYVSFTSKPEILRLGQTVGDLDEDEFKRLQIRKTVEAHLDKELKLRPKGIKVLSLFFIDKVANYRWYDDDGNSRQGKYAVIFEEEYARAIRKPKYDTLFQEVERETAPQGVHDGYFAIDKKKDAGGRGRLKDSTGEGKTLADESAYQLIMRDKETLLSFDSKLKFIFSHSALKEGWDNPNVFQICTLNETASMMKKRQEIGRGLRICVDQNGERVHGFDVNTLTVMANESYDQFARELQKEIETEVGIKFGVVEKHLFAGIVKSLENGRPQYVGVEASEALWDHLKDKGYIDAKGKIQDSLRSDLKNGKVELPDTFAAQAEPITRILKKVAGKLNIKDGNKKETVRLNKAVFLGKEFKALWERIKYHTTFRVDFDVEDLIQKCSEEINQNLVVGRTRFVTQTTTLDIDRGGVQTGKLLEQRALYEGRDYRLPDIVTYLQNETNLTRRTLVEILKRSDKLQEFKANPQKYIEQVSTIIRHQMRVFIVDGIKYQKIGNDHYYAQELFERNELLGYLGQNMLESKKSVYDHVIFDSDVEEGFAKSFELNEDIKVYAKLPPWFTIDTPLGSYNPDWAVLVEMDGAERLYFVVETKGSLFTDALRPTEQAKIDCGRRHFKALNTEVDFAVVNSFKSFSDHFAL